MSTNVLNQTIAPRRPLPHAEEALSDSEARYRALFEDSPGGNYVTNGDDTLVACNGTFTALIGFESPLAAAGRSMAPLYASPEERTALLEQLTPTSPRQTREVGMLTTTRRPLRVQESVVGVFDAGGRLTRVHGFLLDVTDRRLAEAALEQRDADLRQSQKMEAIGRLAGGVAHDFNNLLTAIVGYAELAESETSVERIHEHLGEIKKAGDSATALTKQLLAFSRKQPLSPEIVELNAVILRMEGLLRRTLGEDIDFRFEPCGLNPRLLADRVQLEQVILNLAVNARDAMPDGGTLAISTRCVDAHVLLAVADTGEGIPPEALPHVFEPFFTTKGLGKGTGLGLATVYGIVNRIGGRIHATNNPERGCTFTVALPLTAAPAAEAEKARGGPAPGSETILLVEDEPTVRNLAQTLLHRHGYHVLAARDVEHALAIASDQTEPIDLLLSDVVMPGMSGPDLAIRLSAVRPTLKVLFMSGYVDHPQLQSGVSGALVTKPFTASTLTDAVRTALDHAASARKSRFSPRP